MELHDIGEGELYFDAPLSGEVKEMLRRARSREPFGESEGFLLQAYLRAPERIAVQLAIYRFYYRRHTWQSALDVTERILEVIGRRLGMQHGWRRLEQFSLSQGAPISIAMIRLYLLALKSAGQLYLRLGDPHEAIERLHKVVELDTKDSVAARGLLKLARGVVDGASFSLGKKGYEG